MSTRMNPCGCMFEIETGKQVTVCLECRPHELNVMKAAWELVLRGASDTPRWGSFQQRLSQLHHALLAAGKPEDYDVQDPHQTYGWHGIL